ncbi:MAG TPA: nitronate monooxygenase [Labilithrix sp.]|nr:nitronate monooxygenase [Labilithrix sp.]
MNPDRRITELFGIELPIVQAPMAGAHDHALAVAVAEAGALGSLPCAMLTVDGIRAEVAAFRSHTSKPLNLNFFCHVPPAPDPGKTARWLELLRPYYDELAVDPSAPQTGPARAPFGEAQCAVVEELRPAIVSFHFGLPERGLVERVRRAGAKIVGCATTVAEARSLEANGCDAIIAQGAEAGGHRGMFLSDDVSAQVGTFALVPQVASAVKVPVIAAGGVTDARGIAAAFALGAAGVQIGTAYLRCPEARISPIHRAALAAGRDDATRITNVFTGRPARGFETRLVRELGPLNEAAPPFPTATAPLLPLRAKAEERGSSDFSPLWAGQASALAREATAGDLTRALAAETRALMRALAE